MPHTSTYDPSLTCTKTVAGCRFITAPAAAFGSPERGITLIARLEESSRTLKALVACAECGQLYGMFFTETDWAMGPEDMLTEMVQVKDRFDLDPLTSSAGADWKGRLFVREFLAHDKDPEFTSGIHSGAASLAAVM